MTNPMERKDEPRDWELSHIVTELETVDTSGMLTTEKEIQYAFWFSPSTQRVKKVRVE